MVHNLILNGDVHGFFESVLNFLCFFDDDEVFQLFLGVDDVSLLEMGFGYLSFKQIVHPAQLFVALLLMFNLFLYFNLTFVLLLK